MSLNAVMSGKHTSRRNKKHPVYPYLLRNLSITRPNQVWATDITYIPMKKGYMYLTAIIDLHSRYLLNWSVSNSMDSTWCKQTLEDAIKMHGALEIQNTDQGSQYTAEEFANYVKQAGIKLSMDGKGRATDNDFIERLRRNVKYEKLYLNPPEDGVKLYSLLKECFNYYNHERRHQAINYEKPNNKYQNAA